MRLIFIPGLGEDEKIFEHLLPLVPGDKQVLNTWDLFGDTPRGKTDPLGFAREITDRWKISADDILIGHSLGGLLADYIKYHVGCRIIQVSSYTENDRVFFPISNSRFIKFGVKTDIAFNQFVKWIILKLQYDKRPSKPIFSYVFTLLKNGNKNNIINQLSVALAPVPPQVNIEPDLRIHASNDQILRPPKQPYIPVPGDHFSVYTYPQEVADIINRFLQNNIPGYVMTISESSPDDSANHFSNKKNSNEKPA